MQPDDERLPDFNDDLENSHLPHNDEDAELYGASSSPRLSDAFYAVETRPRVATDGNAAISSGSAEAAHTAEAASGTHPEATISHQATVAAVRAHIEKYIGTPQPLFSPDDDFASSDHFASSDDFAPFAEYSHIEVFHVAPTPARPFHTLVTCGMSDRAMSAPGDEIRYAELVATLPADWPVSALLDSFDSDYNWPLQWLQILAQLPHDHDTWLGRGHTVPNGDPAEAFSENTDQCCMILLPPLSVAREFRHLQTETGGEEKIINFYAIVPLYKEEMELKLKHGSDTLVKLFRKHGITDVLDPQRRNMCKKHRWWF